MLSLSGRFGLRKTAVGSSLTLHVGVETALGAMISLSLLLSEQMQQTAIQVLERVSGKNAVLLMLGVVVIFAAVFLLLPKLARHGMRFLKTCASCLGDVRLWGSVLVCHGLLWVCQGFAFYLFVRSFINLPWGNACLVAACFAFAWLVGFLSFLTPGGLGIREGLLGFLLANYMVPSQATLVALLCRLWMLGAEILLAGAAFFLYRTGYERQTTVDNL